MVSYLRAHRTWHRPSLRAPEWFKTVAREWLTDWLFVKKYGAICLNRAFYLMLTNQEAACVYACGNIVAYFLRDPKKGVKNKSNIVEWWQETQLLYNISSKKWPWPGPHKIKCMNNRSLWFEIKPYTPHLPNPTNPNWEDSREEIETLLLLRSGR